MTKKGRKWNAEQEKYGGKQGDKTMLFKKRMLWKALQINSFETISKKVQKNLKKGVDNP
ncbi:MAG: hypothetical protein J6K73_12725 [Clostridia bacterium]|nr:hypothetical protein [Clostridia bacterium]